ncbi:MAG: hypothetical protein VKM17_09435 [Cyanobacteriota bacterium]|nr:hypothetical protein [Cyanobacteriota bacterium]
MSHVLSFPPIQLRRIGIVLGILLGLLLSPTTALAVAAIAESPALVQQFQKELSSLQTLQGIYTVQQARRLADLSRLETAISNSNDRPTVENNSSHSLGVFVRSKRQNADQPATFVVLGPGHETDDDFASIALYIPANVTVSWPGRLPETGSTPARVVPLLPGEALEVNDTEALTGYQFNLPAFALESESSDLGTLPTFSQQELDAQPESAPVD